MKDNKRKCFKCEAMSGDDNETRLYRFPKPSLKNIERCQIWAKYCCPDKQWSSVQFHEKLYLEHRMLCHRHFERKIFVDYSLKKLQRNAVPGVQLENDMTKGFIDEETSSLSVPPHSLTPQIGLYEEKTLKASISPVESHIDEHVTQSEAYKLSNNCDKLSQNKDLNDQTILETSSLSHEILHDDPYIKFGLHVGNELRKYDPKTLAYVKSAICEVIQEADKIFMEQRLD